ncbi:7 transmembrane receptor (Secretin) [Branchiostoma belcheri]|nr:7 transmembrane receptor (Secretin) [Branchiostoma belcheri]
MGTLVDRTFSAVFTVLETLSLVRLGGKGDGKPKLNVTVHSAKHVPSHGKVFVSMKHGEEKWRTRTKKSGNHVWDETAEFSPASLPENDDVVLLKIKKVRRCREKTLGTVRVDVPQALWTNGHLPAKRWYGVEVEKNTGFQEKPFLQVSVTLDNEPTKHDQTESFPPEASTAPDLEKAQESTDDYKKREAALIEVFSAIEREASGRNNNTKRSSAEPGSFEASNRTTDATDLNGNGERPSFSTRCRQLLQNVIKKRKPQSKKNEAPSVSNESGNSRPTDDSTLRQPEDDVSAAGEPNYRDVVMSSIDTLWDDLLAKKSYVLEILSYTDSLRTKLASVAPYVMNYIRGLAEKVPETVSYDLPDRVGKSLEELREIEKTLMVLVEQEDKRSVFVKTRYLEEISRIAIEEAPQVLEAGP